jgi:hypothetical protein
MFDSETRAFIPAWKKLKDAQRGAFIPHPCSAPYDKARLAQCKMSNWENAWLSGDPAPPSLPHSWQTIRPHRGDRRHRRWSDGTSG